MNKEKKYKFKDRIGNSYFIKAADMYKARKRAKQVIPYPDFYIEHNLTLKYN